jgi:hypothetical protein
VPYAIVLIVGLQAGDCKFLSPQKWKDPSIDEHRFSICLAMPTKDITIKGTPKIYNAKAASGNSIDRHFCGDCGSYVLLIFSLLYLFWI